MIYWLLAREVNVLRGKHSRDEDWDVVVDLFYYKKADEVIQFLILGC
jgi:small subunit ribosomal protein SAe